MKRLNRETFNEEENRTYSFCDSKYHWRYYGLVSRTGDDGVTQISNKSFCDSIYEFCPDWADRNPAEALLSKLRSTVPDPWHKLSIHPADVAAFHAAKDFCKSDFQMLVINGACGFGKTSLAKMVESDFLRAGQRTYFVACERLMQNFLEAQPARDEIDIESRQAILDMRLADVVVIDDLGTEDKEFSEFFKEQFKMFLDERRGKIIITTNLVKQRLIVKLNDKIVSRLFENSRSIFLKGRDYRRAK
jgi:DNA replication protein DnaC